MELSNLQRYGSQKMTSKTTEIGIGDRVVCMASGKWFGDHFRVLRIFPHGTCYDPKDFTPLPDSPNQNRCIGDFVVVDNCGEDELHDKRYIVLMPKSHVTQVHMRCICPACVQDAYI